MDIRRLPTRRHGLVAAASLAVIGLGAAGCAGSSGGDTSTVTPQKATTTASIGVDDGHLVDGSGRTLYLFEADSGATSTCSGACASAWPPVTTNGDPAATGAAKGGMLGTSARDDGSTQVTYAGHPLYRYAGDSAPGDTNGAGSDEFGAEWYPVAPSGEAVETGEDSGDDSGGSTTPSDSGYDYSY
jgi:predicted lipoprotein with Yx(FWY)xxD motif